MGSLKPMKPLSTSHSRVSAGWKDRHASVMLRAMTYVMLSLDRNGAVTHCILKRNTREELEKSLVPVLKPESALSTDGNLSYQTIVKNLSYELDHKRLIAIDNQRVIDGIYHIQTLNNWMMRWKQWLRQFNGVGTDYLDSYISWFRQMKQSQ